MEKNSKSNLSSFLTALDTCFREKKVPEKFHSILSAFYKNYRQALESHALSLSSYHEELFLTFLHLIQEQFSSPYVFEPFHKSIRTPFDYYSFGVDFLRPLIDVSHSTVKGMGNLQEIVSILSKKENVLLLANHQTEADPIIISILLEKSYPELAQEMIFVAGDRVVTDPLAIPFSMGRNLLCIYSKRYIDHPKELRAQKQLHNKRTMDLMRALLSEGGKCIYVAPSGGRDRRSEQGVVEVAPFDPQSIEMLYLMAQRAEKPSHFFPLSLATYNMLPPPETIQVELGEVRTAKRGAVHFCFGEEIDMENFPGSSVQDKHERRQRRAQWIFEQVQQGYKKCL